VKRGFTGRAIVMVPCAVLLETSGSATEVTTPTRLVTLPGAPASIVVVIVALSPASSVVVFALRADRIVGITGLSHDLEVFTQLGLPPRS
jgi:hypothetical protein